MGKGDYTLERIRKNTRVTAILLAVFILFTIAIKHIDVKPIGPQNSEVGFAALNGFVHKIIGVHEIWYSLTGCLGAIAIAIVCCAAALGAAQLIIRRNLWKVDMEILVLGGFYALIFAIYLFFEAAKVNCRPVLEKGVLEASYPSSHTVLVCCIMATIFPLVDSLFHKNANVMKISKIVSAVFIVLMVVGRLISGVHWFTDILGAVLLSTTLVQLFYTVFEYVQFRLKGKRHI